MNAVLPHQYALCFYAPCFLNSLISIKSNLNASYTRPLSIGEPWWTHATRLLTAGSKNPGESWRANTTPFPCLAPGFPCPTFLNLFFPSLPSFPSLIPTAVRNFNPNPCPLLAFLPSRCTPDSLAAPKRLAPPWHVLGPIPA